MKKEILLYSKKEKGLFKKLYIIFYLGYMPLILLQIILNVLGIMPVTFNDQEVYGFLGVLGIIMLSPLYVLLITVVIWLYYMMGYLIIKILKKLFYE